MLTSDPANISLSGPHRMTDPMRAAIIEEAKRQQKKYHRAPDKSDISSPCGFEHLVSIGSRDYAKFFSLQTFVNNNTTSRNLLKKFPRRITMAKQNGYRNHQEGRLHDLRS